MSEVELKIEEILEGKQNPFWFLHDRDDDKEFADYYENNKEEIRKVIEEIIQKRKINLKQLYNLFVVYFEDKLVTANNKDVVKKIEKMTEISKYNSKNLKLLITFSGMCENADVLECYIEGLSDLLDE